jgi:hypothetical protein
MFLINLLKRRLSNVTFSTKIQTIIYGSYAEFYLVVTYALFLTLNHLIKHKKDALRGNIHAGCRAEVFPYQHQVNQYIIAHPSEL